MSMPVTVCHRCGRLAIDCRCMQEDAASLRSSGASSGGVFKRCADCGTHCNCPAPGTELRTSDVRHCQRRDNHGPSCWVNLGGTCDCRCEACTSLRSADASHGISDDTFSTVHDEPVARRAVRATRFPMRTCKSCGHKTTSTSTIDHCLECGDEDGLRPRHFLSAPKTEETWGTCKHHPGAEPGCGECLQDLLAAPLRTSSMVQNVSEDVKRDDPDKVIYELNCRVFALKDAIYRAMRSAEDAGILGADAFGILQGVVHDGIPAAPNASQATEDEKDRALGLARQGYDAILATLVQLRPCLHLYDFASTACRKCGAPRHTEAHRPSDDPRANADCAGCRSYRACEKHAAPSSGQAVEHIGANVGLDAAGVVYVRKKEGVALAKILRDIWDSYEATEIVDDEELFDEEKRRVRTALSLWLGEEELPESLRGGR